MSWTDLNATGGMNALSPWMQVSAQCTQMDRLNAGLSTATKNYSTFALARISCWNVAIRCCCQLLHDLRLHVFQFWQLRFANIVQTNDVKTKLAFHSRSATVSPFSKPPWHLKNSLTKLPGAAQSKSPPLAPEPGSLDCFLAKSFKFGAFFQAGVNGFGLVFSLYQNMACTVFFAAIGCHEFVVLGFDVSVGDSDWFFGTC
jgi:hypothetical protein